MERTEDGGHGLQQAEQLTVCEVLDGWHFFEARIRVGDGFGGEQRQEVAQAPDAPRGAQTARTGARIERRDAARAGAAPLRSRRGR